MKYRNCGSSSPYNHCILSLEKITFVQIKDEQQGEL